MKILQIITQSVIGGAQSVVSELSNALSKDGHDLIVMSKTDGPMWNTLNSNIKRVQCTNFTRNVSPINDYKSYLFIRKIIKREKPDVIHLHTSKIGLLGRLAAWPFYTKKTYYTMHGFDQIRVAHKKFLPLEILLKNLCKKIITVSNYDAQNLRKHNIKNITLIVNGVSDKRDIVKDKKIVEKIASFSTGKNIVLTVARDAKPKRFDLFLEVAALLPQYTFIWIGNKEKKEDIPKNVLCLGEIPNAGIYTSLADLFLLLSDHEGHPISIIEALSCSTPVLASNVGGIPEIIHSNFAFLTENDSENIKDTIINILTNKDSLSLIKKNARKEYENNYTIELMKKRYIELYEG